MEEKTPSANDMIVMDKATSQLSDLWKKEDYWAIWLGFILMIAALLIYLPQKPEGMADIIKNANTVLKEESEKAPFKTIAWFTAMDQKDKLKAVDAPIGKKIKSFTSHPHGWTTNPLDSFIRTASSADAKNKNAMPAYEAAKTREAEALDLAKQAEAAAAEEGFTNEALNSDATGKIDAWRLAKSKVSGAKKKIGNKAYNQLPPLTGLMIAMAVFFGIGIKVMGESFIKFLIGFVFVFFIALLAYMAGEQATSKYYGIGYPAWAIIIGLLISNTIGTPKWVMPAVQTEYFIKTGLVVLGAEILFGKILYIGIPGIFVAWIVTPIVLVSTYIFGQKVVKIPSKTLNITISADMSVCGVSAAIATAAACRAKKEELTLAVGLSLVFTAVMMVFMPIFIKAAGMPYILGGAWMGGTIDSTGAVAAAGAFLSDRAMYVAATIKMIQNVLIGVTAFFVALYWCARVECAPGQKVSIMEIWHRFPKFVLGFITASIIFSILYQALGNDAGYTLIDQGAISGMTKIFRGWFFCLAFTSIGLATNFRELKEYFKGGKPLILYVCGQSFNLVLTLTMAYIMFYIVFPEITARI